MKRLRHAIGGIVGIAILLVSGVAIFFASCEKEDLGGAKEGIAVHFTLGNTSYGAEEVVTRGGGQLKKSETVIIPIEEDVQMYATIEEDVRGTLRTTTTIADGTLVRIVAYDDGGSYVGDALYKVVSAEGGIEPVGTGLSVPSVGDYTFVAYSYNSTTNIPPYSTSIAVYPHFYHDPLWGSENETISGSTNNITIKMRHLLSLFSVEVTTAELSATPPAITAIKNFAMSPNYGATLTVASGTLTPVDKETFDSGINYGAPLSSWSDIGTSTITSEAYLVYTDNDNIVLKIVLEVDGVNYGGVVQFNMTLESGKSYALKMSLKKKIVFAGSNIYWKWNDEGDPDQGGYLTFDASGAAIANQRRQGVFFKWGSLVGVSPAGSQESSYDPNNTEIYAPKYDDVLSSWDWEDPNTFHLDWEDILYVADNFPYDTSYGFYFNHLGDDARNTANDYEYWKAGKGDICRFISENGYGPDESGNKYAYRMPVLSELASKMVYTYGSDGWTKSSVTWNIETGNAEGTYPMDNYISNSSGNVTFPASGFRGEVDGTLYYVGQEGGCFSATHGGSGNFFLSFNDNAIAVLTGFQARAYPVRCVRTN
jgi:hypothetical protein